jgi:hypothetical protein
LSGTVDLLNELLFELCRIIQRRLRIDHDKLHRPIHRPPCGVANMQVEHPRAIGGNGHRNLQQSFAGWDLYGPLAGSLLGFRIDQGKMDIVGRGQSPRLQLQGKLLAAPKHHVILLRRKTDHAGRVPGRLEEKSAHVGQTGWPGAHEPERVVAGRQVQVEHLLGIVVRFPLSATESRVGQESAVQSQVCRPGTGLYPKLVPAGLWDAKNVFRLAITGQEVRPLDLGPLRLAQVLGTVKLAGLDLDPPFGAVGIADPDRY